MAIYCAKCGGQVHVTGPCKTCSKMARREKKINAEWTKLEAAGKVRFTCKPDEICDMDDLKGDTFNREVNPEIPEEKMAEQEREFEALVEREGVWGIIGEYFDGEVWQYGDSVWGMIGDNVLDNDYTLDIKSLTIDAYRAVRLCPTCGRPRRKKAK
jgi:hypothetical protein